MYYMKVHVNLEIRIEIKSLNIQLNSFCKIHSPFNLKIPKKVYMSVNNPPYLYSFASSIKYLVILESINNHNYTLYMYVIVLVQNIICSCEDWMTLVLLLSYQNFDNRYQTQQSKTAPMWRTCLGKNFWTLPWIKLWHWTRRQGRLDSKRLIVSYVYFYHLSPRLLFYVQCSQYIFILDYDHQLVSIDCVY